MEVSEEHQCRVCDAVFNSYDELEKHCSLHIREQDFQNSGAGCTNTVHVATTSAGLNSVCSETTDLKTCIKLVETHQTVPKPESIRIKLEPRDCVNITKPNLSKSDTKDCMQFNKNDSSCPEEVKIKIENADTGNVLKITEVNKPNTSLSIGVLQKPNQTPRNSTGNGLTLIRPVMLHPNNTGEPQSEIVRKFPNIFSAITKPSTKFERQVKRKPSVEVEKEKIKRPRLPEAGFACHLCGESFNRKDKLRQHMHTHMKEKFFKCDICSEKFLEKTVLEKHRSKHFFKCDICDEGFVKYSDLKAHTSKHESISKFTCHVCRKNFPFKSVLLAHMDVHNTGAFHCDHCPAKFNGRSQLSKHFFTHHTNKIELKKGPMPNVNTNTSITVTNNLNSTTASVPATTSSEPGTSTVKTEPALVTN